MERLKDKKVLVTGRGSGLGRATAIARAIEATNVVIASCREALQRGRGLRVGHLASPGRFILRDRS